jgi:hypothetical protein
MHVLPRVRELHERFADTLTVIGVHAGKFVTERHTERIAQACDRLGVLHAVVNDRQYRVWREYAVNAWPTLIAIDPEGYIAFIAPGEVPTDVLAEQIERIAGRARERGTLVPGPDPTSPRLIRHEGTLRFPTRVVADGGTLWIADTGHGRVLECDWRPEELAATVRAEHDGFAEPRGLAVLGGSLFVADRAGQAVWRLGSEQGPERVAGTGVIAPSQVAAGRAQEQALRSPWGLAVHGERLAIAMAGAHQLWTLDLRRGKLELLAGNGYEEIADGPARRAALAQPTGVAMLAEDALAFADCETSAVREYANGSINTLVGTGLFKFGDRDGIGSAAQLQHCEDVAVYQGVLAVADTYNDRLKRVDPQTRECVAWPGEAGLEGALREPGGVSSDGPTLLVADTGNHRVVSVGPEGVLREVRLG